VNVLGVPHLQKCRTESITARFWSGLIIVHFQNVNLQVASAVDMPMPFLCLVVGLSMTDVKQFRNCFGLPISLLQSR
jgi:hypothetical protein